MNAEGRQELVLLEGRKSRDPEVKKKGAQTSGKSDRNLTVSLQYLFGVREKNFLGQTPIHVDAGLIQRKRKMQLPWTFPALSLFFGLRGKNLSTDRSSTFGHLNNAVDIGMTLTLYVAFI